MKRKVAFIMPYLGKSGAERVVFNLLNQLDRDKFELHLLLYKNDPIKNSLLSGLKSDVEVSYLNIEGRIRTSILKFILRIRSFCKKNDIHTILISDGASNAALSPFLFLLGSNVKKIARESNLPTFFEKNSVVRMLYRNFYKNYDSIIVQSNEMYEDLTSKFLISEKKITKINNPIDIDNIKKLCNEEKDCYSNSKFNLLTIGRLTFQKGFDLLLNAFSSMDHERFHLTIIGDGEDKQSLEKLSLSLNIDKHVTFINSTENPYVYMKNADVFISSSRWEGYPNVVIESIACGTPVVANRYPGGIEEIINKKNGLICDICDAKQMKAAIKDALVLRDVSFDMTRNVEIISAYEKILL